MRDQNIESRFNLRAVEDKNRVAFLYSLSQVEDQFVRLLDAAFAEISSTILMSSPPAYDTTRIVEGLATTKMQVYNRMRLLASSMSEEADRHVQAVASYGQMSVVDMLQQEGLLEAATKASSPDVALASTLRSRTLGSYGVPLVEIIERNTTDAAREVMALVRRGIAGGLDIKQVIASIQPVIIKREASSNARVVESLFSRTVKAVRTEFAAVYKDAQFGAGKASGLTLTWTSTLSDKHAMPDVCSEYNGRKFYTSDTALRRFPYHVNCLCYLTPGVDK